MVKLYPSDWERWNADLALGWTPDEDTWVERPVVKRMVRQFMLA